MVQISEVYENTANELVERIKALIPENPHIMHMTNPFDLLDIEEFKYDDLEPSYYQAVWALAKAKEA